MQSIQTKKSEYTEQIRNKTWRAITRHISGYGKKRRPFGSNVSGIKKLMDNTGNNDDTIQYIEACVEHAESILLFQTPQVKDKKFDFSPTMQKMCTELFLVGVMWRFSEQFDYPTSPRDRAYICLIHYLMRNGMSMKDAKKRIKFLNSISLDENGEDTLPISIGYEVGDREDALATVLEQYRDNPVVSGQTHRMLGKFKIVSIVLAITTFIISLIVDRSFGEAVSIGLVTGVSILIIGSLIYHQITNTKQQ